jgi:hypothetical protein
MPPSEHAWRVVTGEDPITDSQGETRPATPLIYIWFQEFLSETCKRDVRGVGKHFTPEHRWTSSSYFEGRSMVDLAEELEPIALAAAAEAVDSHDPTKGPLIPWMRRILRQRVGRGLRQWSAGSSSVNAEREGHLPLDEEEHIGTGSTYWGSIPPVLATDEVDKELVRTALAALDPIEEEALRRFSEGESYGSIARNMDLVGTTSASRIVKRAQAKAREELA